MADQIPENSVHPMTRSQWRGWLEENYGRLQGVWFIRYKKSSSKPYVDVNDAVMDFKCQAS